MLLAILAIGAIGFFVWAHHMYVAGIADDSKLFFSASTMIIAVPTAVKLFTWTSTACSTTTICADLLSLLALEICFTLGGFTGIALSSASMDTVYHDSYFVVGHFHLVLSIAAMLSVLIALKAFTQLALAQATTQTSSRLILLVLTTSVLWLFGLQHALGVDGHPRRIFTSTEMHQVLIEVSNLCIPVLV